MYLTLAILAGFTLIYGAIAGRLERTWISGAVVFTGFGLIFGDHGFGLLRFDINAESLRTVAELTLALVLFADAAGADLGVLRRFKRLPARLLLIGLPLTILLGFGVGKLMFGALSVFEIALLATMLAPTDAALGKAVVSNEAVPDSVRQGLNVESGLNDGICVPILFLFLALAQGQVGDGGPWQEGLTLFLEEVGIGVVTGVVLSGVAVWLLRFCQVRDWLSDTWMKIIVVALAFTCFGTAQALGGSGFIASFVGGMLFGGLLQEYRHKLLTAAEGIGDTFSLVMWVLFGAVVVGQAFDYFSWPALIYAALSLTVVRMLPVYLTLFGLKADTESKLFIGWFGPRGLASIVFIIIVMGAGLPHQTTLVTVVVWTVILSVIAHGISANPWAAAYGRRAANKP